MKYTRENPHPDLKYVKTNGKVVFYRCIRCGQCWNGVHHFGWQCPDCSERDES